MHKFDTLFLDRDGVINLKLNNRYVQNPEEFEFIKGSKQAISKLSKVFNRILVVTNQQGIGKGIMSVDDLLSLHTYMLDELREFDAVIDQIYFCPHLISDKCSCRKPDVGMLRQAIIDYPEIKINNSYLVGDSDSDIEAGKKIGLNTIKVDNKYTLAKWSDDILSYL